MTETLTSSQAAGEVGCSVQTWHRLAERYALTPAMQAPGKRGAKFWRTADVRRVARHETKRGAA